MLWLISIMFERMRKFAAMSNKPSAEKIRLLKKDKWNWVYIGGFITFMIGLALRLASVMSTEDVFFKNLEAFQGTGRDVYNGTEYYNNQNQFIDWVGFEG